jgi:hypothetical protein
MAMRACAWWVWACGVRAKQQQSSPLKLHPPCPDQRGMTWPANSNGCTSSLIFPLDTCLLLLLLLLCSCHCRVHCIGVLLLLPL